MHIIQPEKWLGEEGIKLLFGLKVAQVPKSCNPFLESDSKMK